MRSILRELTANDLVDGREFVGISDNALAASGLPPGPLPGRRASLPATAAAVLAALLAAPAAAQTTITLISNTGQADGGTGGLHIDHAQAFTTGSHSTGYKLTGIDIKLASTNSGVNSATVTIHADASGAPGATLGTLTKTSQLTSNAVNSWTNSAGIDLTASTTYFMVFNGTGTAQTSAGALRNTASDSEDTGGQPGWSIADGSLFKNQEDTPWSPFDQSKMIAVKGYAKSSNNAPVFNPSTLTRSIDENTAAGQNVGAAVTATDGDGDTLSYALGGTDAASFDIVSASGQIRTKTGVTYDHETKDSYALTVTASDPNGGTAVATVTVNVADVDEPPSAPGRPGVAPTARTIDSLTVRWDPPDNTGPPITGYDVRFDEYSLFFPADWMDGPQGVSGTTATLTGLKPAQTYDVAVRAVNAEGTGPWSDAGRNDTLRPDVPVGSEQPFVPSELTIGDRFRLLFVQLDLPLPSAENSRIHNYDRDVRGAAQTHTSVIVSAIGTTFRALASTRLVDARAHTDTAPTETDNGVPIYWVNGGKVADDYEDFYDGDWDDEAGTRNEFGNPQPVPQGVWTGSANDGTELLEGEVSRALGQPQAGYGTPGSAVEGAGPLHGGSVADSTETRPLYGLSLVLRVTAGLLAGNYLEDTAAHGSAARRFQTFATGGNPDGYELDGIGVSYRDFERDRLSAALYTVDASGHPDTLVTSLETPEVFWAADHPVETLFGAPSGTVLNPDTTYAVLFSPEVDGTDVVLAPTASDAEEAESLSGWSIGDAFGIESGGSWQLDPDGRALRIQVRGTVVPGPPGKPTGLDATAVDRYRIDLDWDAPEFDGNLPISGYKIEVSSDAGTTWADLVADTGLTATTYSHTGLASGSTRHYRVSAINSAGTSDPSDTDSATTAPNRAPMFPVPSATVSVNENTPAGTNISGAGRTATDADGDTIAYSFLTTGGSDYTHFALDPANGQVSTHGALDHEARTSYSVTVRATDPEGAVGAIAYTINVADRNEPPDAPATPSVAAVPVDDPLNPQYRLQVSWIPPPNDGRPPISGYDVQYRRGTSGAWTDGPQDISATETTLAGLEEDAPSQVRVLARNDEGVSPWSSPPGSGRTNSRDNSAPVFGQTSVVLTVVENTAADADIGSPVSATDNENDTITYSLVGTESAAFAIDGSSGQVRTKDPLDFETKSSYAFQVRAEDDRGASSTASVRVDVTNAVELPAVPNPPLVTATFRSDTSIDVSWTAPANTGPPIDSYDLQWREGTSGSWTDGPQNVSGTSAAIGGLATGTQHQVRVRASNADGDTAWSGPGTGSTNTEGNQPPSFSRASATFSVPENSPGGIAVGTPLTATDPDTDPADVLTYSLEGADAASFDIESATGQIRTRAGEDYDYEARDRYAVIVKADDSHGGTDTIDVTIRLTDVREPPAAPTGLELEPVRGSATSLEASWTPPATPDRPHVTSYDLRYRKTGDTDWRNGPQNRPSALAEITGLEAGVTYEAQVRATSAEGDSDWSDPPASGAPHALAVQVVQSPARHDGSASFAVRFQFSEEITITDEEEFRDNAARASGGSLTAARRISGRLWEVTLEPSSDAAVVVSLDSGGGCSGLGALCTAGGAPLSHGLDHAVPGPDTALVSIRSVSSPVTEGSPAVFELRREGALLTDPLTVSLEVLTDGDLFGGSPPTTATFEAGETALTLSVATVDDTTAEPGGYVLYRLESASTLSPGYVPGPAREAAVQVRDNDGGQPPPLPPLRRAARQGASGASESSGRGAEPLELTLWTDRPGYRAGETVRLYRTLDPHDDGGRYRTFVYLEKAGGGERRYLATLFGEATLRSAAVDHRGIAAWAAPARSLFAAEKALVWEGPAPAPGLWQFVLDLRPEGASGLDTEIDPQREADRLIRRAWAKFAVARHSQLLNRRSFDREIATDLTLRGDTRYFLRHQLFVRAGATLTIEPGTLVQAYGRHAAIIVEQGGRIVAEGTREAPVVLTCSLPVGRREPGCWGGLRILGRAPVTRLEGTAEGVLPPQRPVYGGSDPRDSSGVLRHVRVEFAGAGGEPGSPSPAIGLYAAGDGTVIDRLQAHASLGNGIAFSGGTASCGHCVASGSGAAGLAWERGWRGSASHLFVQHGPGGGDGIDGAGDEQGWDLEPRSLPVLSNVTLVHAYPYGKREREAAGLLLRDGSGVQARDLLVTRFGGGAVKAGQRAVLLFAEGESAVARSLFRFNGIRHLRYRLQQLDDSAIEFTDRDPQLRDVRYVPNPDPRPRENSRALQADAEPGDPASGQQAGPDGRADEGPDAETPKAPNYIGAFGPDTNWLEEWTFFGPESDYDTREADGQDN